MTDNGTYAELDSGQWLSSRLTSTRMFTGWPLVACCPSIASVKCSIRPPCCCIQQRRYATEEQALAGHAEVVEGLFGPGLSHKSVHPGPDS